MQTINNEKMIGSIVRLILQLGAGFGVGTLLDHYIGRKVTPEPPITVKDSAGNWDFKKIAWFLALMAVGTLAVRFIAKKLNLKILK